MPPVVIAAGIAAVGAITAAKLSSDASGDAIDAQMSASDKALAYQREQDAKREEAMQAWQGNREALLRRWGVDIGLTQPAQPRLSRDERQFRLESRLPEGRMPFNAGQPVPTQVASGGPAQVPGASAQVPVGANVGDLVRRPGPWNQWNDWEALGLRRG